MTDPTRRWFGVDLIDDVVDEALGHGHRRDPVCAGTGGPAGNARLTSWTGLVLLVLIAAELVTLLDVTGLLGWHVGIGVAMTAFALAKTASTGWRILRYYGGSARYRRAGPPPPLLRMLGPLVILGTLGVLGSGIALVAIGPTATRTVLFTVVGQSVSPLTLHQGFFILFAVFAGLHLLARFVPAVSLATGRPTRPDPASAPGGRLRLVALVVTAVAGGIAVAAVLPTAPGWQRFHEHEFPRDRPAARPVPGPTGAPGR